MVARSTLSTGQVMNRLMQFTLAKCKCAVKGQVLCSGAQEWDAENVGEDLPRRPESRS